MKRWHIRTQHPVGQGFFSSGLVSGDDLRPFSYVYDCGAMGRYAAARDREIRKCLRCLKHNQGRLDVLFLSHMHADHINGLPRLLDPVKGVHVDTIVLPLVNVQERLIAFARTAAVDPVAAGDVFYQRFVVAPGEALGEFNPRQIIFTRKGDGESGAPGGDGEPPTPVPSAEERPNRSETPWHLVGRGRIGRRVGEQGKPAGSAAGPAQLEMPDTIALAVGSGQDAWLLAPFVDPEIEDQRDTFIQVLAKNLGVTQNELETSLEDRSYMKDLVTNHHGVLAGAYEAIASDLNITSLCLYSGPVNQSSRVSREIRSRFGRVAYSRRGGENLRVAWLATGDAALKQIKRRDAFTSHYGKLLREVATLTLPHHGSDHNFDAGLLDKVMPDICVAVADRYSKWKHPGPNTVQAVCSHPSMLHVVTSAPLSRMMEIVQFL